ncbi:hypothetical protein Vi05172_g9365 [Venturia inaequalis]|nr:hypothetical protein Vi05172_g9365 [Venturia inaequalis]
MRFQTLFLLSLATSIMATDCRTDKDCGSGQKCQSCGALGERKACVVAYKCDIIFFCRCNG